MTIAGGITTVEEIAALRSSRSRRPGRDGPVHRGHLRSATPRPHRWSQTRADGLWPTVVVDEAGVALGMVWSSPESLRQAVETRRGVYHSRSRGIWVKGATSGATQELLRVDADCDRDTLRFTVRQHGPGFCHTGDRTCWGADHGLGRLQRRILTAETDPDSNTKKLFDDPTLLAAKLREEAGELAETGDSERVVAEAADLLYFVLVKSRCLRCEPGRDRERARPSGTTGDPTADDCQGTAMNRLRRADPGAVPIARRPVDLETIREAATIVEDVRVGGETALRLTPRNWAIWSQTARLVLDRDRLEATFGLPVGRGTRRPGTCDGSDSIVRPGTAGFPPGSRHRGHRRKGRSSLDPGVVRGGATPPVVVTRFPRRC